MRKELLQKIKLTLEDKSIKKIMESEEYYFGLALDKFNQYINISKVGEEKTEELISNIRGLRNENKFNFSKFLDGLDKDTEEYKLILIIGELIAYIDLHAANKNIYNKYEDKRTIANSYVRQHDWVMNFLRYKQYEDLDDIVPSIRNAIIYLMNPAEKITVLSENHRKLIARYVFNKNDYEDFNKLVIDNFRTLNINIKNKDNESLVYSRMFYIESLKKYWNFNKNIWKISHGNNNEFKEGEKEQLLKDNFITVHKDTKKSQGKNFMETMKIGDIFYLCYGGKEVKLIGRITSNPMVYTEDGWMKRRYEIIKNSINNSKYTGISRGWSPNYNSTFSMVKSEQLPVFEKELLMPYFDMTLDELFTVEEIDTIPTVYFEEKDDNDNGEKQEEQEESIFSDLNYILYGPPGTGKTYNSINYAVAILENKETDEIGAEDYNQVKQRYNDYKNLGQIDFTTFHQAYGYEEFIEGIRPCLNSDDKKDISYILEKGVFSQLCERAEKNPKDNYVMIIDEINRANISKVFGELITLIEKTKRIGEVEEVRTILPYSKIEFGVPKNLFILGTMNTADRSIALLDTALRRRFKFIEMLPNTKVLNMMNENKDIDVDGVNINKMVDVMNKRIEILYDREHTIGHSFFIDLIWNNSIDKLKDIFTGKIIPLLQEYFFDDYEKVRLVLGDNQYEAEDIQFINVSDIPKELFGAVYYNESFEDRKVYRLNIEAFSNAEAYKKIYSGVKDEE